MTEKSHIYTKTDDLYEMDIDIHSWAYLARKGYYDIRDFQQLM